MVQYYREPSLKDTRSGDSGAWPSGWVWRTPFVEHAQSPDLQLGRAPDVFFNRAAYRGRHRFGTVIDHGVEGATPSCPYCAAGATGSGWANAPHAEVGFAAVAPRRPDRWASELVVSGAASLRAVARFSLIIPRLLIL